MKVIILGTSSAVPAAGRNPSSQFIWIHDIPFLIDCGEGTLMQLMKYKVKYLNLHSIFISHLHADHFLGIFGLLSTMSLYGRSKSLTIYSPKGIEEMFQVFEKVSEMSLNFELSFKNLENQTAVILEKESIRITSFPLNHRIQCNGFLFEELPLRKKIKTELLEKYKVKGNETKKIIEGNDFLTSTGELIKNETFFYPIEAPQKYAYVTDTRVVETNIELLKNVDILYHEATFTSDLEERAVATFHSTALEAAAFAANCNAKRLLIGHFSARYHKTDALLFEAKKAFNKTEIAVEGKEYYC